MKQFKFFPLFLIFLLIAGTINAESLSPFPVAGRITYDNQLLYNIEVTVRDIDCYNSATREVGESIIVKTNNFGEYNVDLANFKCTVGPSDMVRVTVAGYSTAVKLNYGAQANIELKDKVSGPDVIEYTKYVCSDGSKVTDPNQCPKLCDNNVWVAGDESCPVKCEDGSYADTLDQCSTTEDNEWEMYLLIIGAVIALLYTLFAIDRKKYKWAKGMAGILNYRVNEAKKAKASGDTVKAKKKIATALKTANTITLKYSDKKKEG